MSQLVTVSKRFSPEEIFQLVKKCDGDIEVEGYQVRTTSLRYILFRKKPKCATCSRRVSYGLLQTDEQSKYKRAHFNFFAEDGMLMTKDHVIPKSKGVKTVSKIYRLCARFVIVKKATKSRYLYQQ